MIQLSEIKWLTGNLGQNISRLFYFLAQFLFTTSETELQSFTKYLRLTLVFMWNTALREKFNFCFQEFFVSIIFVSIKFFIFPGRLCTRLSFYEI